MVQAPRYSRFFVLSFLVIALLSIVTAAQGLAQPIDLLGRLNVLFLGDTGHHQPAKRAAQIYPHLSAQGIQLEYTNDVGALNPDNLALYDVLVFFGNAPYITKDQEVALLNFVAAGKGLVVIHAGIAMFANSDAYTYLVGGTFKSHGVGTFSVKQVKPNHPAIKNVPVFESWDETYVHMRHGRDKEVLAVHEENGRSEPWTWVRAHGKGRVFYTAWGHDERTWSNSGFHKQIEAGIRWAAGEDKQHAGQPLAELEYAEDGQLPNYPSGKGWGVTEAPFTQIQKPLSPEASMAQTFIEPGFRVELFAAEPDIVNPVDMAWDERGRLWVVETLDYPNEFKPERKGDDRIKILEDTNGDGRADKFTIFADGLNIPTSLVFSNGGVIVAQAPDMLFLKDTDGDDRADVKEVLFSGWGIVDTHAGPNNLRYGFDNQIWGAVGYSGFNGSLNGEDSLRFGQSVFRFDREATQIEHMATFNNNTWGLTFSEDGFVFGSTANNSPVMHAAIPERYYRQVWDKASASVLNTIADDGSFYPVVSDVRQVDWHGKYTAGSGYEIYTARQFPKSYWNRVGFIGGPTGHLLGKFTHKPAGSGFVAHNNWNMIASRDEWFSPIQVKVGPEGALWFIDWYNLVIQHNPKPDGFEMGEGNAYENELRDKQHSRIYKMVYKNAPAVEPLNLANATPEELVQTLTHDNLFWRNTAQRLLVEQNQKGIVSLLYNLMEDVHVDEVGHNPGAFHALWALHGLGLLDGSNAKALRVAQKALYHPATSVQRAALMVLPRTHQLLDVILQAGILPDPAVPEGMNYTVRLDQMDAASPHVRLAAVLAVADMPYSPIAGKAIADLLSGPDNVNDPNIRTAAMAAGMQHYGAFLTQMLQSKAEGDSTFTSNQKQVVHQVVARQVALQGTEQIEVWLQDIGQAKPHIAEAVLRGLAEGLPDEPAKNDRLNTLLDALPDVLQSAADAVREKLNS